MSIFRVDGRTYLLYTQEKEIVQEELRHEPQVPPQISFEEDEEDDPNIQTHLISQCLASVMPQVRAIYERCLKLNPKIAGKIEVRIEIAEDGKALAVEVTSDSTSCEQLKRELMELLTRHRFPKSEKTVAISIPFSFKPLNKTKVSDT